MSTTATITIQNKKYTYTIAATPQKEVVRFVCLAAHIEQDFLAEDIPALLIDLPNLIIAELDYKKADTEVVRFRISAEDKKVIQQKAVKNGYKSLSDYVRARA